MNPARWTSESNLLQKIYSKSFVNRLAETAPALSEQPFFARTAFVHGVLCDWDPNAVLNPKDALKTARDRINNIRIMDKANEICTTLEAENHAPSEIGIFVSGTVMILSRMVDTFFARNFQAACFRAA